MGKSLVNPLPPSHHHQLGLQPRPPSTNTAELSNTPEISPTKAKRNSKVNREFLYCWKEVHRRDSSSAAGLTVSDSATIARQAVESRSERRRFLNGSICRVMYPLCRSWGGVTQRPRLQGVSSYQP